jgi:hypothetical protein
VESIEAKVADLLSRAASESPVDVGAMQLKLGLRRTAGSKRRRVMNEVISMTIVDSATGKVLAKDSQCVAIPSPHRTYSLASRSLACHFLRRGVFAIRALSSVVCLCSSTGVKLGQQTGGNRWPTLPLIQAARAIFDSELLALCSGIGANQLGDSSLQCEKDSHECGPSQMALYVASFKLHMVNAAVFAQVEHDPFATR